mmetsp:Transcript_109964/g.206107  ORF Transcript_109964/g.206107 Transcript_109964/m.206107 type:complete len:338 (+) Transcript_109964:37-1050(+)
MELMMTPRDSFLWETPPEGRKGPSPPIFSEEGAAGKVDRRAVHLDLARGSGLHRMRCASPVLERQSSQQTQKALVSWGVELPLDGRGSSRKRSLSMPPPTTTKLELMDNWDQQMRGAKMHFSGNDLDLIGGKKKIPQPPRGDEMSRQARIALCTFSIEHALQRRPASAILAVIEESRKAKPVQPAPRKIKANSQALYNTMWCPEMKTPRPRVLVDKSRQWNSNHHKHSSLQIQRLQKTMCINESPTIGEPKSLANACRSRQLVIPKKMLGVALPTPSTCSPTTCLSTPDELSPIESPITCYSPEPSEASDEVDDTAIECLIAKPLQAPDDLYTFCKA